MTRHPWHLLPLIPVAIAAVILAIGALTGCEAPTPSPTDPDPGPVRPAPCRDYVEDASRAYRVTCPWAEQALTFERSPNGETWLACRCPRPGGVK